VLDTDLKWAFPCPPRAARRMLAAGRSGRIVGTTSVHETRPRVAAGAHCAAEGDLGLLTEVAARELGDAGITVDSLAPGETATPMTGQEDEDPTAPDERRPGSAVARPGDAREVAAVVAFLAPPAAAHVNGTPWPVEGGMLQMPPMAGSTTTTDDWRTP
jgi:NAD(P)-dependent dehydrogenase (short-subunit alcohol dehydrogenase family)